MLPYSLNPFGVSGLTEFLSETPGEVSITLAKGNYQMDLHAGGGAGGTNNNGSGGCGGKGNHEVFNFELSRATKIKVVIGDGGKIRSDGNGGRAGTMGGRYAYGTTGGDTVNGYGGGGGFPTYVIIDDTYYIAQGGGGGGGAGQINGTSRYSGGGGGGGGGGLYFMTSEGTLTSIVGQPGAGGAQCYAAGWGGIAGNPDFPNNRSANGSVGNNGKPGGTGQFGGGASGGAGSGSNGNHSSAYGGIGGGGAGGDDDAGAGGVPGWGQVTYKTVPTIVFDWQGNETQLGKGGLPGQSGGSGWIYIKKIKPSQTKL